MPGIISTRRNPKQNSEEIEDARWTQANGHQDDVSDEDQPRPVQGKRNKGKQRAIQPEMDDAEGDGGADTDDDSDEEDRIDVQNFVDQPLRREHLSRLKGISQDWESMRKQISQRCDIYKDVAAAMAEGGETDIQSSKILKILDDGIKEFIDIGMEMTAHSEALDVIHQNVARGDPVCEAMEQYQAEVKERIDAYAGKTARQKYAKDKRYVDFHASIWEARHPDDPMPPINEFIEKENDDDSDADSDLEMGGVTQKYLCPLTLTHLVNPVTSEVCGHSYSRDAIKEYCKYEGRVSKCPASGCNKSFKLSDCQPDPDLAKKVKVHQRRQRAAEADSDAEEVVD